MTMYEVSGTDDVLETSSTSVAAVFVDISAEINN